jgi:signal transduction histidine kinase
MRRRRHLIFLAHIWACVPFAAAWYFIPGVRQEPRPEVLGPAAALGAVVFTALVLRTLLAWFDPPWLAWDYFFPVADAIVVTVALFLRRQADSVILFLYLIPIAEAVSTLNVTWAAAIGLFSVVLAAAVSYGQSSRWPLEAWFRLFFLFIVANLMTWMARLGAELRAELTVAADRNRLALEMHDGIQGQLITIAAQAELARCVGPADPARAAQTAGRIRDLARQAADELRFLVQRLRAPELGSGFQPALRQYLHHLGERNGLAVSLELVGGEEVLAPEVEQVLFRVVQESLNNTLKHASARTVTVELDCERDPVRCAIRDDGAGFDPRDLEADGGAGCGLAGMRERIGQAGGDLQVESAPGAGTVVTATLPRQPSRRRERRGGEDPRPAR